MPILPATARRPFSQTRAASSSRLRLRPLLGQKRLFLALGRGLVAVVGLVVDHDDVLLVAEGPADPADHLLGRFLELVEVAVGAGEDLLGERCRLEACRGAGRHGSW